MHEKGQLLAKTLFESNFPRNVFANGNVSREQIVYLKFEMNFAILELNVN